MSFLQLRYKDTLGSWRSCRILRCDQVWGKYKGNRGLAVRAALKQWYAGTELELIRNMAMHHYNYIAPNAKIHVGKYHNGDHGYWGAQEGMTETWAAKVRTNFVAPYDGVYRFLMTVDDELRAQTGFDAETGEYQELGRITAHCGIFNLGCRTLSDSHSKRFTLQKGESLPLQFEAKNGGSSGYMNVAVQYLGKDAAGTWIDEISKDEFNQDSYGYERQELHFYKTYWEDSVWIFIKWDDDLANAGTGLEAGETFDAGKRAWFRLKFCGDENNCYTTPSLSADDADHPDGRFEEALEDLIKARQENLCQQQGSMNPELYHGTYEDTEPWPTTHHFHKEAGSWCGKKSHELHNHDFYNYHINGEFSTEDYPDLCMAYFGIMEQIAIHVRYTRSDNDQDWHGWLYYQSNWDAQEWTWTCVEINVILDSALVHHNLPPRKEGTHFWRIRYMRPSNFHAQIVYVDEVRIGKMRQDLQMVRTQKSIAFDGQVPYNVDVDKSNNDNGCRIKIRWLTNNSRARCGYNSILPTVLPPDGANFVVHSDSDQETLTTGADWTVSDPLPVNVYRPEDGADLSSLGVDPEAGKQYNYGRINYVDNNDNVRHIMHVHVLKGSDVDEDIAGSAELFYGNDPEPLMIDFGRWNYQKTLQSALHARWPELDDNGLTTRVYRYGWCQAGWNYRIQTYDHGRMKPFTLGTITYTNSRNKDPAPETKLITDPGVVTYIMPGSVTATEHHYPQVVVTANGQRSACDNCDFVYAAAYSPEVTSVADGTGSTPTTVTKGDALTLTYDLKSYTGTRENIEVLIGTVPMVNCNTASVTSVTCNVGDVPEGTHSIILRIPEVGDAVSGTMVSVQNTISSHSPTVGSQHGGTIVTISGAGFGADQVVTVDIGGSATSCDSAGFDVTYDQLICRTDANANIASGDTPNLASISLNKFTIHGGEQFTLTGTDLTGDGCTGLVFVGTTEATVISWTDTEIVAETAAGMTPDMDADTKAYVCNKGYTNTINTSVQLKATGVSASFSSLYRGRIVTIDGFGFATNDMEAESIDVTAGGIPCTVTSSTKAKIVCSTGAHSNRVALKLGAAGITDLSGNAASSVTVEVGQEVHWKWNIQIPGVVPVVHLQEVSVSGDAETTTDAYWSQSFSGSTGNYVRQFLAEGTYHYSTGYLDSATIYHSGTITVVGATDKAYKMSISVNGVDVEHKQDSDNNQPSGACDSTGAISTPAVIADSGFYMTYSWSTTPVLSSFSVTSPDVPGLNDIPFLPYIHSPVATVNANMGQLDAAGCAGDISIMANEYNCDIDSTTGASVTCTINPDDALDVADEHWMSFSVANMGNVYYYDYSVHPNYTTLVYLDTAFQIAFGPYVDSLSPSEFSKFGDVDMIITGKGFVSESEVRVYFQNDLKRAFYCDVTAVTYTSISCRLPRIVSHKTEADYDMSGYIQVITSNALPFIFGTFSFTDAGTPKVDSITPTSISSAGQTLSIDGTVLGGLTVTIGGQECINVVVAGDFASATCDIPNLATGSHAVNFHATNGYVVSDDFMVESTLTVSGISPTSGGTNGGSRVTITGFGFDHDTIVQVYTSDGEILCEFCYKDSVTASEIVFFTPTANAVGAAEVRVSHEYVSTTIAPQTFTYTSTDAVVSGSSTTLTGLDGGENMVLTGSNFGTCNNVKLEVVIPKDPCADGQHYCPWNSACAPNADGTDYICSCNTPDDSFDSYGSGLQCYNFYRDNDKFATFAEAEAECVKGKRRVFEVNSKNDEDLLKQLLIVIEGTKDRGVFFKWYGSETCGRIDGTGEFEFPGDCDTWGSDSDSFTKRPICKFYPERNCYHDDLDNGKHSYNGKWATNFAGLTCQKWSDTADGVQDTSDYDSDNNYCRNNGDSSSGINCYGHVETDGDLPSSSCGIPKCSDLHAGIGRRQCRIKSAAPIDRDAIYKVGWTGSVSYCLFSISGAATNY